MNTVDVAIIGAGFAGLSAAHALRADGATIALLEAQEQPGGRVKTVILDGAAYEKGGQFFCTAMTEVCALVERYGLTRRDIRKRPGVVAMVSGQRRVLDEDFLAQAFFEAIFEAAPDTPGSLLDWTLSLGLDAAGIAMIKSGCEEILGRPIEELSFRSVRDSLTRIEDLEGNTMEFACVEGLGTLAGLMAEDLDKAFRANAPVTAVDRTDGRFSLTTPGGLIASKQVIYAASPAVLRQIDWKAPQDQWLTSQPDRFVAGKMRKIVMRYDHAFWLDSDFGWLGQTDDPSGLSVMDCSDAKGGSDVLTVFCGGTAAMALHGLSEAAALTRVMDIIERMLGPEVRHPIRVVQTDWTDHPWVGGGYDTWAKPWDAHDPQAPMREGHDGLSFCGAELAPSYPGFIEGAVRSGQDVAARVRQQG